MKNIDKYIHFEIEITTAPFKAFFGGGEEKEETKVMTEDDFDFMEKMSRIS